jgi:hypothetical protein
MPPSLSPSFGRAKRKESGPERKQKRAHNPAGTAYQRDDNKPNAQGDHEPEPQRGFGFVHTQLQSYLWLFPMLSRDFELDATLPHALRRDQRLSTGSGDDDDEVLDIKALLRAFGSLRKHFAMFIIQLKGTTGTYLRF